MKSIIEDNSLVGDFSEDWVRSRIVDAVVQGPHLHKVPDEFPGFIAENQGGKVRSDIATRNHNGYCYTLLRVVGFFVREDFPAGCPVDDDFLDWNCWEYLDSRANYWDKYPEWEKLLPFITVYNEIDHWMDTQNFITIKFSDDPVSVDAKIGLWQHDHRSGDRIFHDFSCSFREYIELL